MKKFAAMLVALALLLSAGALAFNGTGYPAWDGVTVPSDALSASFDGERISLRFDPSQEFSNVASGVIQACFFAYDETEEHYLELYLLLPQNVLSGDRFRSGEGLRCSICLYETALGDEVFYYAGDASDRGADNSSYEITVESVQNNVSSLHMQGQFTAQLCRYDGNQPSRIALSVDEAFFDFTLPLVPVSDDPTRTPEPSFPATPQEPGEPQVTFPAIPQEPGEPQVTFPAIPQEPGEPQVTFPAIPQEPDFPGFPSFPQEPAAGPSFTLPPDYAVI